MSGRDGEKMEQKGLWNERNEEKGSKALEKRENFD